MRIKPTEAETQKAILELLAAHKIFAGRLNTGAGFVKGRPIQHHTFGKGCADILAFIPDKGRCCPECECEYDFACWIEVKAPGKKQSPEQISFQNHVHSLGHTYMCVDSVDQVDAWLKEIGA